MSHQTLPSSTGEQPPADPPNTEFGDPPPPEGKKSGRSKIVAIVAGVLVLALVAGGFAAFFLMRTEQHNIVTPDKAGSLQRDNAKEDESEAALELAEKQFRGQGDDKNVEYVKSAIYSDGDEATFAFLGAKLKKNEDPSTWLNKDVRAVAKENKLRVTKVSPGDNGGLALCVTQATGEAFGCAWATDDTRGWLLPINGSTDADQVAKIMREVRTDVEQPK